MNVSMDDAFNVRVDDWVAELLSRRLLSFGDLLQTLPGVYPEVVLASVDRLAAGGRVASSVAALIRRQSKTAEQRYVRPRCLLPLPHPLNFEWRFTSETSRRLLDTASTLGRADSRLLLFGTPSLAVEAMSSAIRRPITFVGEDNAVTKRIAALNDVIDRPLDIAVCANDFPRDRASVVVVDPPWYIDFFRPMLRAAAAACEMGGFVLASLPPVGARPTATADRTLIARLAQRLGLDHVEERSGAIRYDTPFFERNVLAARGIVVPPHWRSGDLFLFRKQRESSLPMPSKGGRRDSWTEVSIGRMRLFVRRDGVSPSGLRGILPLVEGDVLQSVSRRNPLRRKAQLWTSGNRIFATDNADLVLEAARAYHAKGKQSSAQQPEVARSAARSDAVARLAGELGRLAAREANEELGLELEQRGKGWTSASLSYSREFTATPSG